jgi:Mrp family chromosome partitioning ATPase
VFNESMINSLESQLGASQSALAEARRNRFTAEAALGNRHGSQEPGDGTLALALQGALGDNSLTSFKNALTGRKAQLMVGMSGLSPQHPERIGAEKEIKAIDRELEAVTLALRDRLAKNMQTIDEAKLRQSKEVEGQIQRETETLHQQIENYSRGYQRSVAIGDEIERLRKRVDAVEDRENFLELESKAPGFVRVFSPALAPDEPYEGGRKKLLMMVLAAGVVFGLVVPVGMDFMDPRLKAPRELESHLGLPITGWMPESALVDPACLLRAAVSIRRHAKQLRHRVLVVSAISHGGGSSTVSLGLGLALDRLGTRTIVIEANPLTRDVRYHGKAGLEGLIPWMNKPISERLPVTLGSDELPDRVATGAGTVEDLLPVERLLPLFEKEADAWDLILIDAAPLESSLATEELIRVFGSVLLVVNSQIDKKKEVTRCMEKIDQLAPETFGAVLNRVTGPSPLFGTGKAHDDLPAVLTA